MLMLSPFANADMDYVCVIDVGKDVYALDWIFDEMEDAIDEYGCKRNNILLLTVPPDLTEYTSIITKESLFYASILWCRQDRNEKIEGNQLRCVLYDTKPRKFLK